MSEPIFPAAAPLTTPDVADEHPPHCACIPCTDALLARIARPLAQPGPQTDPALLPAGRAAAHLGLVGTVRDDEEPDDPEAPPPPLPAGVDGYQVGGRVRPPVDSPDRAAHPGIPTIRTARSGAKQGAAGTGACPPHPTRGGAAA